MLDFFSLECACGLDAFRNYNLAAAEAKSTAMIPLRHGAQIGFSYMFIKFHRYFIGAEKSGSRNICPQGLQNVLTNLSLLSLLDLKS